MRLSFLKKFLSEFITFHKACITFVVIKLKTEINFSNVKVDLHRLRFTLKAFWDIFLYNLHLRNE